MKNWMLGTLLALLAPLSLAGQLDGVKVSLVAFNADLGNLFYTQATPAGGSGRECGYAVLRLPPLTTDASKGLLSILMSAQATQSKVNITYKVIASVGCEISGVQVLSGT